MSIPDQKIPADPKIPVSIKAAEITDIPQLKALTSGYKKRDFLQWINDRYIFHIARLNPAPDSPALSFPGKGKLSTDTPPPTHSSDKIRNPAPEINVIGYVCVCPAHKFNNKLVSMLKLKDTDYWAVDAYIHPAYRGKGINVAIASSFLAQARQEGYTRGYGSILYDNNASRRSYAFLGEKEIGIFTTITIFGCTFHFLKKSSGYEDFFR